MGTIDCFYEYDCPRTVYPGETIQVSVVAVGQRHGTVPSRVVSIIDQDSNRGYLPDCQHLQQVNNMCTKLNYTVFLLCFDCLRTWKQSCMQKVACVQNLVT